MAELSLDGTHPLRRICQAWTEKIKRAEELRRPWYDVAEDCMKFYSSSCGFLWDPEYKKFWNTEDGAVAPKFRLTLQKSFEAVALLGPYLYWRCPGRSAKPKDPFEIPEDLLRTALDPGLQMVYQQAMGEYYQEMPARTLRAILMEKILNWTAQDCRLHDSGELATVEGIVKGRGVLWTMPYQAPGSELLTISSWYDDVYNLLIDPDATSPLFDDAWWVVQLCREPVWKKSRETGIPEEILKKAAGFESAGGQAELNSASSSYERATGESQDVIEYSRVWSRMGIGSRLTGAKFELKEMLDGLAGDYCYLEVAAGLPFFLNFTTNHLGAVLGRQTDSAQAERAIRRLRWPIPFWKDRRWPCQILDLYRKPGSIYPVGLISTALGELKALNVFFAHFCNRIWMSMRDFIVVADSASEKIKKIIERGDDLSFLPLESVNRSIKDVVEFLQQPNMRMDGWRMMQELAESIDRRLGTSPLLYGMQGPVQSRSATDVKIRQGNLSIRPEYMASKVQEWQSEIAKAEALAVRMVMEGRDVAPILGNTGAMLYERLVLNSPVDRTVGEIDYTVEAESTKRPNKEEDAENINKFIQNFGAPLMQYSMGSGDFVPVNEMIRLWGEAVGFKAKNLRFGAGQAEQQAAMQQQQAAMQQQQAEAFAAQQQAESQRVEQEHQQKLRHTQETHGQRLQQTAQQAAVKIATEAARARSKPSAAARR